MRCTVAGLLAAVLAFGLAGRATAADFTPLLAGDDPAQFEVVGLDKGALTIKDGEVRLAARAEGYFATKDSYRNYVLRFDWLYEAGYHAQPADGNSGLLLHVQGPAKVWPKGIEVQIWYKDFGSFYTHAGAALRPKTDDRTARDKVLKPPGQWNAQEVTSQDGALRVRVNGTDYASAVGAAPDQGKVGWMAEGSPIRFRKLEIKKLD
jgi:hypothetical protein